MATPGGFDPNELIRGKGYGAAMQSVLTRLSALVNWEARVRTAEMRVSTLPCRALLSRLGDPQLALRAVHVTGSKGKGTVCALIAAGLRRAPFRRDGDSTPVALYSSPHVECITERLRLDTTPVSEDRFAASLQAALDARAPSSSSTGSSSSSSSGGASDEDRLLAETTWFDVITAASMHAAAAAGVERAVVEVGMGGHLDSTNVLNAPVSVVTNIHLEHAHVIGPTRANIAGEKAGIIAPGARAIVGMSHADELAPIFTAEAHKHAPPAVVRFVPPQPGDSLLATNARIARAALSAVARSEGLVEPAESDSYDHCDAQWLPDDAIEEALAHLPARSERFVVHSARAGGESKRVHVVLDGAHVTESVARALDEMKERTATPLIGVVALSEQKSLPDICAAIAQRTVGVVATAAGSGAPYMTPQTLADGLKASDANLMAVVDDPMKALNMALDEAARRGAGVAVVGSFHLAGRLRAELRRRHVDK